MKLLLIRHAAAIPRGTPGVPDDERPLTPDGKAKFHIAARGLARVTRRPDLLLTSPLPRARATAEIAARAFANIAPTVEPALARSSVDGIVAALKIHPPGARIALVGHEPLLGALLARLLGAAQGGRRAPRWRRPPTWPSRWSRKTPIPQTPRGPRRDPRASGRPAARRGRARH